MENNSQQSAPATVYSYHPLDQLKQQQLEMFWSFQRQEIDQANDFKNHQIPLARIKKIMKADSNVQKVSAESPILFAKACDLFIQELTIHSWFHAEENKRYTLKKEDIAAAITKNNYLQFLVDAVHSDEINKEAAGPGPRPPPSQAGQSSCQAAEDNPYASGMNSGHSNLGGQS